MDLKNIHTEAQVKDKTYKYLWLIFIVFICTYSFSLYVVQNYQILYESREYPMWVHVKKLINNKSDIKQKVILIGDSRAKAGFQPVLSENNALNLAVGGSTPVEGYYALRTFLKNNPAPENLVLSYSPLHLTHDMTFWVRTVKYDFLLEDEINNIIFDLKKHPDPGIGKDNNVWKYNLLTSMYISSVAEGIKNRRWATNEKVKENILRSKGHAYFGTREGSDLLNGEVKEASDFQYSELIDYYFVKLVELANSSSINVFWYTMPFNDASCNRISSELKNGFNSYIEMIKIKTEINVVTKIHCLDNKYFGDASHVYRGSRITTRDILTVIE